MLHGREPELGRCARLLDDARAGRAGALAVLGEPGVGKSALLEAVTAHAEDFRVLRTYGLESEAPLAFAALHRLLRPVQDLLPALPVPQAHALRVAFGLDSGISVEPFLIALATLSLLADAAETAPVLCVVDDAHWLDTASRDALLFAARRLTDERVAVVLTARATSGSSFDPAGIDTLVLGGLDEEAASTVLAERSRVPLPAAVVRALVARTGGNPLALVELPSTLTADQLAGTEPLPERLPLTQAVERSFLDRVRRLSQSGQTALLVASADDSGRLRVVRDACARLRSARTAEAAVSLSPLSTSPSTPAGSNGEPEVSRAVKTTATRSSVSRRAANSSASREAVSSQCASSTTHRTGAASAASASSDSVASAMRNGSTDVPLSRPKATRRACACGGGSAGRRSCTGRRSRCRAAKASGASDSRPCVRRTRNCSAWAVTASSSADFPTPGSPSTTSAPARPARASSSSRAHRTSSGSRPCSTAERYPGDLAR